MLLLEFDLCREIGAGARFDPPNAENDWLRLCAPVFKVPGGEVRMADFGLELDISGLRDGDCDSRTNGLLRHLGPFVAVIDILLSIRHPYANPKELKHY